MSKTRLLIADDHTLFRRGLRLLLDAEHDIEVVGEASDGVEAVALTRRLGPDIMLLDISMPGISGLEVTRLLQQEFPLLKVLILTMHDDEGYLREVLRAGAAGYVLKKAADTELTAAIRAVSRGETFVYPSLTRPLVNAYLETLKTIPSEQATRTAFDGLTAREVTVLRLLALGYTNQEIADALIVSVKTVETHRSHVMEKLGLKSRADLVRYAMRKGLLTASE